MAAFTFPLYIAGAGEYECGAPFFRTTLALLADNPIAEWGVVFVMCACFGVAGFIVALMLARESQCTNDTHTNLKPSSTPRHFLNALIWLMVTAVLSTPSCFYALSKTVPGDQNTLGVSTNMLSAFQRSIGPVIAFINAVPVPKAARWLVDGNPHHSSVFILFSRFMVSLIVPCITLLIFGQDCYAKWVTLWTPCTDHVGSFELSGTVSATGFINGSCGAANGVMECVNGGTIKLISHDDICAGAQQLYPGKCSRFVIESLAELIVAKLMVTAFLSPALILLSCVPFIKKAKEKAMAFVTGNSEWLDSNSFDSEVAGLVMLIDLALVFGSTVPLVPLLVSVAMSLHLAVYHLAVERLGMQVRYAAKLPTTYLVLSLALGCGLPVWFFVDNSDHIVGAYVACVGIPSMACAGLVAGFCWHHYLRGTSSDGEELGSLVKLTTPLMAGDNSGTPETGREQLWGNHAIQSEVDNQHAIEF